MTTGDIRKIEAHTAIDFIIDKHYAGRKPVISEAFGWFVGGELMAVVTFGKPASPQLCYGICGKQYASRVYELNRLIRVDEFKQPLSYLVGYALRELRSKDWIIVSYSDTGMNHHGYIYQACNFLYTGRTKQRTDRYLEGKHSRHADHDNANGIRQMRTSKHRYIYFCTSNKKLKREWMDALNYPVQPYPKGDNQNYILGTVYKAPLVDACGNIIKQDNSMIIEE